MFDCDLDQANGPASWYAVRVRSNFENTVSTVLRGKGYQEFLPTHRSRTKTTHKAIELPLFPGYVFCRLDITKRLPVMITPGVVNFVSFGSTPCAIPDEEIEAVQQMVRSKLPVGPWPHLRAGQKILIERGPLAGLEGMLVEHKGAFRIAVSISLLQRTIVAEIDNDWVRPIK